MKVNIELKLEEETALRLLRHVQQGSPAQETPERLAAMIVTQYIHDHYPTPPDGQYTLAVLDEASRRVDLQAERPPFYTMEEFTLIVGAWDIGSRAAESKDEEEPGNAPDAAAEGVQDASCGEYPQAEEETVLDPAISLTDDQRRILDGQCEQYDREHEAHMHDLATHPVGDEEEGVITEQPGWFHHQQPAGLAFHRVLHRRRQDDPGADPARER